MSERERAEREACRRFAPILALLDDSAALSPDERTAALDHLAGCDWCRADLRADAQLDAALRRAFAPTMSAAPLRTRDLLTAIGATGEPATQGGRPSQAAMRSVVYLDDLDDVAATRGYDEMSEQDSQDARDDGLTREPLTSPAPGRRMAAIPSLRPAPGRLGRRTWALGFSATAAAVALIVVSVALLGSHMRPTINTGPFAGAGATQTALAHAGSAPLPQGGIAAISMDSPTDGWALGESTEQLKAGLSSTQAPLYHYDGVRWTLAQEVGGFQTDSPNPPSLQMLSATDGWAFDGLSQVLHYDGTTWNPVTIALPGATQITQLRALHMVSPTEGWAAALLASASPQAMLGFLRYDGQQWTLDPGVISVPGLDMNQLSMGGISALPDGDVWAVGSAPPLPTSGAPQTQPATGLIFHRLHGVWNLARALSLPGAPTGVIPHDVLMVSATNGWIVGEIDRYQTSSNSVIMGTQALLLHFDGATWTQVTVPFAITTQHDLLQQIVATGPDNIWAIGESAERGNAAGVPIFGTLLHYDGATWTQLTPQLNISNVREVAVSTIAITANGDLWGGATVYRTQYNAPGLATVSPLLCMLHDGAWSVMTPAAG